MIGAAWLAIRAVVAPWLSATWLRILVPLAVVALVALAGWRISVWHDSHRALQATEKALATRTAKLKQCTADAQVVQQAAREAAGKAARVEAANQATAERIARELETRLADADGRARDLARRLHDYQARRCAGAVPGAAPASGEPASAPGEPAGSDPVGEATAALVSACARDSLRLEGWQAWWAGVSAGGE